MRLIPFRRKDKSLLLSAYSYSADELGALTTVLNRAGIKWAQEQLPPDDQGRQGLLCIITAGDVAAVEKQLGVAFRGYEADTSVTVAGAGKTYRCRELQRGGDGPGCVDLVAKDDVEARVKCALLANSSRWFGGVAEPGKCDAPGRLFSRASGLFSR